MLSMRVLVSTTAGAGHFSPLVPVARACADGGHEVLVAAPESFRDSVTSAGFRHAAFADAPPELMAQAFSRLPSLSYEQANQLVIADVFGRLDAQAALPGVSEIFDAWEPDLVLRDPCEFASLAVAATSGVRQAMVAIGVSAMTDAVANLVGAPLAELDVLAGLTVGSCAAAMATTETLTAVPAILDGRPAGRLHRYREGAACTPAGTLPDSWGEPAHPLVYVTFGSVTGSQSRFAGLYRAVLDALADQPVRVLLTTGHGLDPAELRPVPDNARVERWWVQADVMPHAAAVVGHGGFGTTMGAIAAGVPQVIMPLFSLDQRLNADHVEAVGAGLALRSGPDDVSRIPAAVRVLLAGTSYRDAARQVASQIAKLPPVTDMVPVLETIAAGAGLDPVSPA
jgi:UDP:flavonoid glycosyltransferase YjiC (YdhE family)